MLRRAITALTLVCLLTSSIAGCAGQPAPPTPTATLSRTSGEVLLMKAGTTTWSQVSAGVNLKPGDRIKTGANSSALITFFEGSTIELQADTEVGVEELSIAKETGSTTIKLNQKLGKTRSRVEKLTDPASRYEVETPSGAALVRGSIIDVVVLTTGVTIVTAVEGQCSVTAQGVTVTLGAGMQTTIVPGQPPSPPGPAGGALGGPAGSPPAGGPPVGPPSSLPPPQARFTASPTTGAAPLAVQFTDLSGSRVSSWAWNFGDGGASAGQNPNHTYNNPGTYTVSLTVTGVGGVATRIITDYITVLAPFTVDITSPADGSTVNARTVNVVGAISDVLINQAILTINGVAHNIAVVGGAFNSNENVTQGTNTITVTATNAQGVSVSDTVTITANIPVIGIRVELTWNTNGTDLDSHLIRPGGNYWGIPDDCHYRNRNPDWGAPGVTVDNPSLDQDVTNGYGPENITLQQPGETGTYEYKVHYYSDHGRGPSSATVRIWIRDVLVATYSRQMSHQEVWDVASIQWPSGNVTPHSTPWFFQPPPGAGKD